MDARILVSHRHEDTAAEAGRLVAALKAEVGNDSTYVDTSMAAGTEWPDSLRNKLRGYLYQKYPMLVARLSKQLCLASIPSQPLRRRTDLLFWIYVKIDLQRNIAHFAL